MQFWYHYVALNKTAADYGKSVSDFRNARHRLKIVIVDKLLVDKVSHVIGVSPNQTPEDCRAVAYVPQRQARCNKCIPIGT